MTQFSLEVAGDFGCFTRPEMKVERVSYDVITPSSVRSIFEAILWKPAIRWQPERIEMLAPIRWTSVRRNEVSSKMSKNGGISGAYIEDERQQRAGLFLRDVHYRLTARLYMTEQAGPDDNPTKFAEIFQRRLEKGQCFNQPYLGCREFACDFRPIRDKVSLDPDTLSNQDRRLLGFEGARPLGWMLYDLDFRDPASPSPRFFNPWIENGIVAIPAADSEEVRG